MTDRSARQPVSPWARRLSMTGRQGQVFLEYAISAIGVVMLLALAVRIWMWVNTTLVERQGKFQASRVEAGTRNTAGAFVDYSPLRDRPLRLALIDTQGGLEWSQDPDSLTSAGGTRGVPAPAGRCDAGESYFERANELFEEARDLRNQSDAYAEEAIEGTCGDLEPEPGPEPSCETPTQREYFDIVNVQIPNAERQRDDAQGEVDRIDLRISDLRNIIIPDLNTQIAVETDPDEIIRLNGLLTAAIDELDDLENVQRPYWAGEQFRWQGEVDRLVARKEEIEATLDSNYREWTRLNALASAKQREAFEQFCLGQAACGTPCPEPDPEPEP